MVPEIVKSTGLYTLQVRMDHLVLFGHPNMKVVPLVDTTSHDQQHQ